MSQVTLDKAMEMIEQARKVRATDESQADQLFEEARKILLALTTEHEDAKVYYECASVHDLLGLERDAVPYYEKAIELGLPDEDLQGAYLGLGSTYRCLGEYEKAVALLIKGANAFPEDHSLKVFLAMALFNTKDYEEAVRILLQSLLATTNSEDIKKYGKAIEYYSERLNQVWE